jgi:hypothetical protein
MMKRTSSPFHQFSFCCWLLPVAPFFYFVPTECQHR